MVDVITYTRFISMGGNSMKLYIKQKVFSIGDKYDVYDEQGNLYYDVKSELFTFMAQIHVNDTRGEELYYIKRKWSFGLARYEIYKGPLVCAAIQQEFAFFRPKLSIQSEYGQFQIEGDFFDWNFAITKDGNVVGSVTKKWLAWSDTYELNIPAGSDSAFFATLVIAIDNCLHNND